MCCIIQDYFANFAVAFVDIITFGSEFFDILMRGQKDN